jgi:hypothetical protein
LGWRHKPSGQTDVDNARDQMAKSATAATGLPPVQVGSCSISILCPKPLIYHRTRTNGLLRKLGNRRPASVTETVDIVAHEETIQSQLPKPREAQVKIRPLAHVVSMYGVFPETNPQRPAISPSRGPFELSPSGASHARSYWHNAPLAAGPGEETAQLT